MFVGGILNPIAWSPQAGLAAVRAAIDEERAARVAAAAAARAAQLEGAAEELARGIIAQEARQVSRRRAWAGAETGAFGEGSRKRAPSPEKAR